MAALERHYSVGEISDLWAISPDKVRQIFRNRPGVLKLDAPERLHKRRYCVLRIPESVLQAVHSELRR
jgi:hypothetical protein